MNLKESFRYQNFLENMMSSAGENITNREHSLAVTKKHLRSKANSDAEDMYENVDFGEFHKNDDVLSFMLFLVNEREKLTTAIGKAKATIGFDLDAAVETNKFRQTLAYRAKIMLRYASSKNMERGTDYKFNAEGNQNQYFYDIEVEYTEAFDREAAKRLVKEIATEADKTSAAIDSAMINTQVDYTAPFNVNDSFDDVMEGFLAMK